MKEGQSSKYNTSTTVGFVQVWMSFDRNISDLDLWPKLFITMRIMVRFYSLVHFSMEIKVTRIFQSFKFNDRKWQKMKENDGKWQKMTEKYLTFDRNSYHNEDIGEVLFLRAFFDDDTGCWDLPKSYGKFHIQRVFCHQHLWHCRNFPSE